MSDKGAIDWKVGMKCIIVDTAHVLHKCPELVGTHAEIKSVPIPPRGLVEVSVSDGRILRLQSAALQPVSQSARNGIITDDLDSDDDNDPSKLSQALKRGTTVRIYRTDTVQQRCPHMIGRIGVIREVPQHPNTWYKVQFSDRKVHTFRPSALRRVQERSVETNAVPLKDGNNEKSGTKASTTEKNKTNTTATQSAAKFSSSQTKRGGVGGASGKPAAYKPSARVRTESANTTSSINNKESSSTTKTPSNRLLSAIDTELWIGMLVKVRGTGRWGGAFGRVLSAGNGWVQLKTTRGEVAKRAYELELVPDTEPIPKGLEWDSVNQCILGEAPIQKVKNTAKEKEEMEIEKKSESRTRSKPKDEAFSAPDGPTAAAGQRRAGARRAEAEAAANYNNNNNESETTLRPGSAASQVINRQQSAKSEGKAKATSNIMSRGSKSTGSSSTTAKQSAYRDSVRKHLERQRDKFKERPNLAEWLDALQAGPWDPNESTGGAYIGAYPDDSDSEQQDTVPLLGPRWNRVAEQRTQDEACRLLPAGCAYCRVEIIPDSCGRVCWNELCIASPIFIGLFDDEVSSPERRAQIVAKMSVNTLSIEPLQSRVLSMAASRCKTAKSLGPGPALLHGQSLIYVNEDVDQAIELEEPTSSPPAFYNKLLEQYENEEAQRLEAKELELARQRDASAAKAAADKARLDAENIIKQEEKEKMLSIAPSSFTTTTNTITVEMNIGKDESSAMQIDPKPEPQDELKLSSETANAPSSIEDTEPIEKNDSDNIDQGGPSKKRIREDDEVNNVAQDKDDLVQPEAKQPRLEAQPQDEAPIQNNADLEEDQDPNIPAAVEASSSGIMHEDDEMVNANNDEIPDEFLPQKVTTTEDEPSCEYSFSRPRPAKAPRLTTGSFALPPSEDEIRQQLGEAPSVRDHTINWPPSKPSSRILPQPITTSGTRFPPPSAAEISSNGDSLSPVPTFIPKPWFEQIEDEKDEDRGQSSVFPPQESSSLEPHSDLINHDNDVIRDFFTNNAQFITTTWLW